MLTFKPHISLPLPRLRKPSGYTARSQKVQADYDARRRQLHDRYGDSPPCPLCSDIDTRAYVRDMGTMWVINNDFPYATYDGLPVQEHLMLIPKRHIGTFHEFSLEEQNDYWQVYAQFSSDGYNSMTRSLGNSRRSVPTHLHTHLLRYAD